MDSCLYCDRKYQNSDRTVLENDLWFVNYDNHPVARGHMKIIPKRHVNSIVELTDEELLSMREIMQKAIQMIDEKFHPDGYNIGINHRRAAGQTKFHLHIHYIPRYEGDTDDPTGGVRNVFPDKGNYLQS